MNRSRIIRIVAVVALIGLIVAGVATHGFGYFGPKDDGPLTLNGNVDIRQVDLGFRVDGRIAEMPFDEGAKVEAGAVLARLDQKPLADQLAQAQGQVEAASAELAKRRNGNRPQDIAQAESQLAEKQAQLASATKDFDRRQELVKTGATSQASFDSTRATYLAAQAQVRGAQQVLSLQQAGSRAEDIDAAKAQYDQAVAQRDRAATNLDDAVLRAPNGGTLLTRAREPGAIIKTGETVLTLTIDRPLRVRAYVAESDLSRISPGMTVEVRADGNQKVYRGTIGFISPTAEFTPKTVQTESLRTDLVYRLRIIVRDPDDALRQGQPVTVAVPGARPAAGR